MRVEYVEVPEEHIEEILNRAKPRYLENAYKIKGWKDHEDFIRMLARRFGKLLKVFVIIDDNKL